MLHVAYKNCKNIYHSSFFNKASVLCFCTLLSLAVWSNYLGKFLTLKMSSNNVRPRRGLVVPGRDLHLVRLPNQVDSKIKLRYFGQFYNTISVRLFLNNFPHSAKLYKFLCAILLKKNVQIFNINFPFLKRLNRIILLLTLSNNPIKSVSSVELVTLSSQKVFFENSNFLSFSSVCNTTAALAKPFHIQSVFHKLQHLHDFSEYLTMSK